MMYIERIYDIIFREVEVTNPGINITVSVIQNFDLDSNEEREKR